MDDILRAIARRDPDSKPYAPKPGDYARFRRWAIDTYGETAWLAYLGNWR